MRLSALLIALFLLASCAPAVQPEGDVSKTEEDYRLVTGTKDVVDPVHGKRVGFWYGAIEGANGTLANGVGFLHVFEDGTSSVTINANIALPNVPERYVVQLSNSAGETVVLGEMNSILGDARHSLNGEADADLSDYLTVSVFRVSGTEGTLVATGTLKQPPAGTW